METNGYTHFIFNNGNEILVRRALKGFGELEVEKFSPVERERCLYSSKCYDQARALSFNDKQMLPSQAVVWYAMSAFEGQNLSVDLKIAVSVESEVCGSCSPWGFGYSSRLTHTVYSFSVGWGADNWPGSQTWAAIFGNKLKAYKIQLLGQEVSCDQEPQIVHFK